MPVEPDSATALANIWPEIDHRLLGETRAPVAPFPLELLPERWRAWVEACARASIPTDYVAQASIAAVSALVGARMHAEVTAEWYEPPVLWQALVGPASSGKSPALARARWLLSEVDERAEPPEDGEEAIPPCRAPTVLADATIAAAGEAARRDARGVVLWRDGLADWLVAANSIGERAGWRAGWDGGPLSFARRSLSSPTQLESFAVGILGTLRPERLEALLGEDEGEDGLAARILYCWPQPASCATVLAEPPDFQGMGDMLQRIALIPGSADAPGVIGFTPDATARIDSLLPELRRRMHEAEDVEAAWIGKGAGNIARLSCHFALMEWAQEPSDEVPAVDVRHVEAAHLLWSSYYLPHAQAVFGRAGASRSGQLARRTVDWFRRNNVRQVSREQIRREALRRTVTAAVADDVIARLEAGHALRALPNQPTGGRFARRWEVNPQL
jgi:hypothetical protein